MSPLVKCILCILLSFMVRSPCPRCPTVLTVPCPCVWQLCPLLSRTLQAISSCTPARGVSTAQGAAASCKHLSQKAVCVPQSGIVIPGEHGVSTAMTPGSTTTITCASTKSASSGKHNSRSTAPGEHCRESEHLGLIDNPQGAPQ